MQKIRPHLWYDAQAVEAAELYTATFPNSKVTDVTTLHDTPSGDCPVVSFERASTIKHAEFVLEGQELAAMESAREHSFGFNEAISLLVDCDTQQAIDYYWGKLSAVPESEQCGWLKDRYGLSWPVRDAVLYDADAAAYHPAHGHEEAVCRSTWIATRPLE